MSEYRVVTFFGDLPNFKIKILWQTVSHGAKLGEIWDARVVVTCMWSTFDLLVSQMVGNSKVAGHSAKRSEIGDSIIVVTIYEIPLTSECVQDHFGVIQCTCLKMASITQERLAVD